MKFKAAILLAGLATGYALGMSDAQLSDGGQGRSKDDRTGACMAVAVIANGSIAGVFACADKKDCSRIDASTALEQAFSRLSVALPAELFQSSRQLREGRH